MLAFDDGRPVRCLIGQQRYGALVVHVAKRNENDHGEPLTFGDVRLVQVLDQQNSAVTTGHRHELLATIVPGSGDDA